MDRSRNGFSDEITESRLIRFVVQVLIITLPGVLGAFYSPSAYAQSNPDRSSIGLIEDGFDALLYRMHLVRNAKHSVDIQTFIWKNDESGHAFMQACIEAADRGVKVRFLMDHLYSDRDLGTAVALSRAHPNLEIRRYRPHGDRLQSGLRKSATHAVVAFRPRNQRMHNKAMIVDHTIAIVGGRNISNAYFNQLSTFNYLDREVFVSGSLVADVSESFEAYWDFERSVPLGELKDVRRRMNQGTIPEWTPPGASHIHFQQGLDKQFLAGDTIDEEIEGLMFAVTDATLSVDPPGKNDRRSPFALWGSSETATDLLAVMDDATERITIETPYLIVDKTSTRFFRNLRDKSPVEVRIVTDSYASTGNMASYAGSFRSRARALALGFEVFEMKPHPEAKNELVPLDSVIVEPATLANAYVSIHAKSMVVDHRISYVGSFNMDPRSIHLNTEIGIIVDDRAFAHLLESKIELLMQPGNSWKVKHRAIPLAGINRKAEWVSRHLPLDVWPVSSTVIREHKPDDEQVVGVLPVKDNLSMKRWMFRLNRALGFFMRPIL